MKDNILIFDIETSADCDIKQFDEYVRTAKVKWIGFYSYKTEQYYEIDVAGNEQLIKNFFSEHEILVGWNSEEFDVPILANNGLLPDKWFNYVDLMRVLGTRVMQGHKNRAALMGIKLPNNKLAGVAGAFGLEISKGDIDYNIFKKDVWDKIEVNRIKKYLKRDIELTKQIFDKTYDFWFPFTEIISQENIDNFSWFKCSIASLTYKYACNVMGVEETYGERGHKEKSEGTGGRVITPVYPEATDVWYVDVTSMYPHIFAMFNLFDETNETFGKYHGNNIFKMKGYYEIQRPHPLLTDLMDKIRKRVKLKIEDPTNPLIYTYKILANSMYGAERNQVFEQLFSENAGEDCCFIGRQMNELMENVFISHGFEVIYGDTDSIMCKKDGATEENVKEILKQIVEIINQNCPFPQETFGIDIEHHIDYIKWAKDKKKVFLKKNYLYTYMQQNERKLEVIGLPVIKSNATNLGFKIYEKVIRPRILTDNHANYSQDFLMDLVHKELDKDMYQLAVTYNTDHADRYKPRMLKDGTMVPSAHINAQISREYFDGNGGRIQLIKNDKYGRVGKTAKYCTIDEAKENKLTIEDLDLTKIKKELTPFCSEWIK